ncbi:MAG TPA: hypothetical protein VNQ80_17745 [Parapedobacter sp.]|uniref:WD40 repeat domain-containing protein n=1 Tax=Parapedobacter sp. TaxID=1958893 RepID=UPI002BD2CEEA|nr:hypothetical protein [Parapedobacter sp.]HWK59191.1 hypothetical protein [Parapedobacter sp.]
MKYVVLIALLVISSLTAMSQRFRPVLSTFSEGSIQALANSPGDSVLYFSDGRHVYRNVNDTLYTRLSNIEGTIQALGINKTGGLLGVAAGDRVYLYNLSNEQIQDSISVSGEGRTVRKLCFSPRGDQMAVALSDFSAQLIDLADLRRLHTFSGHTKEITAMTFDDSGNNLITAGGDRIIRIWNVTSGELTRQLRGHRNWIRALAVSPDGVNLASAGDDRRIYFWCLTDSTQARYRFRTPKNHTNWISDIQYLPDGKLMSLGHDNRLLVWYPFGNTFGMVQRVNRSVGNVVERQPVAFAIGARHDVYVATLGNGLRVDPYFQLNYRKAHPVKVETFNGYTPGSNGLFTFDSTAQVLLNVGRINEIRHIVVENLSTGTKDTLQQSDFNKPIVINLPAKQNTIYVHLIDQDPNVPIERHHFSVYRVMEYRRFLDDYFLKRKFILL